MKILFLSQVLPYPPVSGPQIKNSNVLRYLAERHDVTLISFIRGAAEHEHVDALRAICRKVVPIQIDRARRHDLSALVRSFRTGLPLSIVRDHRPEMVAAVQAELDVGGLDAVHVDQLNMAQYAPAGVPRLLDQHNVVTALVERMRSTTRNPALRWLFTREARLLHDYEARTCRAFDAVTVVTDEDRRLLRRMTGPGVPIETVPIGVNCSTPPRHSPEPTAHVLMLGTMFYPPNSDGVLWFAYEILPLLLQRVPTLRVSVVGARPPASVRRLATLYPQVEVTGFVPDVEPYIRDAALLAVPLRVGGGMRVKILDAFARGLPVVSTSLGAEGIDAEAERDLLLADTPAAFAAAVARVIEDRELAGRLAGNGRRIAEERYDWRAICRAYDALYERIAGQPAPATVPSRAAESVA